MLAIATLALLASAALLFLISLRDGEGSVGPVSLVESRVQRDLEKGAADVQRIVKARKDGRLRVTQFLSEVTTPSFLFEKGKLVFWSDHTVLPDPDLVRTPFRTRVLDTRTGRYLVMRTPLSEHEVVLQYFPLELTYAVSNAYFTSGLNDRYFEGISGVIVTDSTAKLAQVSTKGGQYLFSIRNGSFSGSGPLQRGAVLCLLGGGLAIVLLLQFAAFRYYQRRQWVQGILTGIALPVLLRLIAIWTNFPGGAAELGFFNPRVFAASVWAQSVGDLLLTLLIALLIAVHTWYLFSRPRSIRRNSSNRPIRRFKVAYLAVLYLVLVYLLYWAYTSILVNSRVELDVTQSLHFSFNRVGLMLGFLLVTAIFFLIGQVLVMRLVPNINRLPQQYLPFVGAGILVLATLIGLAGAPEYAILLVVGCSYPIFISLDPFGRNIKGLPIQLYVRVFAVGVISAVIGAMAFFLHQKERDQHQKQQIASNLLMKNDLLGEYLLQEAGEKIASDPMIRRQLLNPIVSADLIRQKITRQYIGSHFNAYDPRVLVFAANGRQISQLDSATTLWGYKATLTTGTERTSYPDLYLRTSQTSRQARTYIQFIEVYEEEGSQLGTIVLELAMKKLPSHSVLPQLLVDQRFAQPSQHKGYSYAIYQKGRMMATGGDFDYRAAFGSSGPLKPGESRKTETRDGYSHLEVSSTGDVEVVVSSGAYLIDNSVANFSFLLLVYTAAMLFLIVVYTLAVPGMRLRIWSSLSAKVQVLLSLGVLVPLALISLAMINQITKAYKDDIKSNYREKGELIQERLSSYTRGDSLMAPREQVAELIAELAQLSDAEIHLYDRSGMLLMASQPLLFESGLMAKLLNPLAYQELASQGRQRTLLTEQAGAWSFNVLYLALRSESGQVSGFLALPFFDSEQELDARVNKLVATVMSIFTLIFLVSGFLTFLASRAVVVPLQLLTEKIRRVTLSKRNEPIQYTADDELGLLVNEYNVMLQKLEESKRELALKEKEQAWREMARQVAHEIKNPLTPMKLSMQYLQYALKAGHEDVQELVDRTSNTIITQIDVLSDIATSFSHFTNLPEPKLEEVSLSTVLLRTADLHNDPLLQTVTTDLPDSELLVVGDEDLLVRIFNNLVLNALQAIPADLTPQIKLRATRLTDREVLAEVEDNGNGIPEELRDKVFVPNFSTKYAGSGIGLAVAKKGIEQMGGRIWFTTSLGVGTTFYIQLPLVD